MRFGAVAIPVDLRKGDQSLPLMLVSQYVGVQVRAELTDELSRATDLSNYKICRKGEIVLNRMSAYQGALGLAPVDGVVSPDYMVLQLRPDQDGRFWTYVMRSRKFVSEMSARVRGIGSPDAKSVRTPRLGYSDLKLIEVPDFKLARQRVIADYLDRETAQIDALIDKQQALIDHLRERRTEVIGHVMAGATSSQRTGTSAWFEWIPAGWSSGRVKHFGSVTLGKMLQSSDTGADVEAPYLRAASVQPHGVLKISDSKKMWFSLRELRLLDLRAGDVVVVEGGVGGYGRAAYVGEDLAGWGFQNSINRIRPYGDNDGRFLTHLLVLARHRGFIESYCNIVSMPHLTAEKLAAMPIVFPPPAQQKALADYLDEETAKIDTLIAKTERFVTLARERRSALITAAVTGQIDVQPKAVW